MDQPATSSLDSSPKGALLRHLAQLVFQHRQLLQLSKAEEEGPYFVDYTPPARDAITLPRYVVYILVGVILVLMATYAIVGHLINDLTHDLADCILGPKPMEDDIEDGGAEIEERRVSISGEAVENTGRMVRQEREGLLPGFHQGTGSCSTPPLRSAMAPYRGEKRASTHNVTFTCPATPYVTSL